MIKFDEKDIKAVASSRYYRKRKWWSISGLLIYLVLAFIVLAFLSKYFWVPFGILTAALFGFLIYDSLGERKARKELVKEWKKVG